MARPLNPDRARIEIVASPEQRQRWEMAARADDLTLSQWVLSLTWLLGCLALIVWARLD